MGSEIRRSEVCSPFQVEPPTCKPPLEIVKDGYAWVVEEFQRGSRNGTTFSTHESRVDAMRAAKERMQDESHPCLLRWDSPNSVRGLYWNPVFEKLAVRYDDLVHAWAVVPEADHVLFYVAADQATAYEYAKAVQREYNFKHLTVYDRDDERQTTRDHRFLRNSITDSGVKFRRAKAPQTSPDDDDTDQEKVETQPTVPSALGTAITDLTEVEILSTDGLLHRYAAPWTDGQQARIVTLASKYGSNQQLRDAFWGIVDQWEELSEEPYVATVFESGEDPTPWVSYRAGEYALAEVHDKLGIEETVSILGDISSALTVAARTEGLGTGVDPENIRLVSVDNEWTGTLADWGLDWTLSAAVGKQRITPYTAPEQVSGKQTATTAVYRLGAVTYWLLSGTEPFVGAADLTQAIQTGDTTPARTFSEVPDGAGDVVDAAMNPRPDDRYETVQEFYYALREQLSSTTSGV